MRARFVLTFAALTIATSAAVYAQTSVPLQTQDQPPAEPQGQPLAPPSPMAQPQPQPAGSAADLCRELLAYAEKKVADARSRQGQSTAAAPSPQATQSGTAAQPGDPAVGGHTQAARADGPQSGTQGGGTTAPSTSTDTKNQPAAPTTAPVASGAAPEAASSPHATDQTTAARQPEQGKLYGGVTVENVRQVAAGGDRSACRTTAQKLRRAGADMPAALIALAAYDPSVNGRSP